MRLSSHLLVITDTNDSILPFQNDCHVDNILVSFEFIKKLQFLWSLRVGKWSNFCSHCSLKVEPHHLRSSRSMIVNKQVGEEGETGDGRDDKKKGVTQQQKHPTLRKHQEGKQALQHQTDDSSPSPPVWLSLSLPRRPGERGSSEPAVSLISTRISIHCAHEDGMGIMRILVHFISYART